MPAHLFSGWHSCWLKIASDIFGDEIEERFDVGMHQTYDTNIAGNICLEDVSLSERKSMDIRYDGNGGKSMYEQQILDRASIWKVDTQEFFHVV